LLRLQNVDVDAGSCDDIVIQELVVTGLAFKML